MKKLRKEKYIVIQEKDTGTYMTVKFQYSVNGKKKTYTKTFSASNYATEVECLNAACNHRDMKRAEMLLHGLPEGTGHTVEQTLNDYFRINKVTIGNKGVLQSRYDKWIAPVYAHVDIASITSYDIQTNLNNMIYEASNDCIGRVACVWKDILRTARLLGLITLSPMDQVIIPKSQIIAEKRKQDITDEEIDTILDYFQTHGKNEMDRYKNMMVYNFIIVMMETGMRPGEVSALIPSNIDFETHTIKVTQSIRSTHDEAITAGRTKTESSIRTIPMTKNCEKALREVLLKSRSKEFVFSSWHGNILQTKTVSSHINTVTKRLGIEFHLYMLRHRFSTKLVTNNVDARTVMELMGHKNYNMTVGYARSDDEKKKTAIEENIEKAFN